MNGLSNVVSCHRKICRRTNDWTTSLWKWKRSANWPAWGGNWWWFVNEAKFYFWKIFSEHTDWFQIFLRWDLLVESKFQFLPWNDGSDKSMFVLDFHPKSLIFATISLKRLNILNAGFVDILMSISGKYENKAWRPPPFCENVISVEI